MSEAFIKILLQKRKREEKYFKNYLFWAKKIKKEVVRNLKGAKVVVFGSVVRNEAGPGSDIDILIISPEFSNPEEKTKIRVEIWRKIGLGSPFEIHPVTPSEYENWYKNFIKEESLVL